MKMLSTLFLVLAMCTAARAIPGIDSQISDIGMSSGNIQAITTLAPVVTAFGLDYEYDGYFDILFDTTSDPDVTVGRIMHSYYDNCDRRGWLEFNISTILNASCINKAYLTLGWASGSNEAPSTSLYGYAGNGLFDTDDIYQTNHLLDSGLSSLYQVDVTSFLKSLKNNSNPYAGFLMVETKDDANRNYSYFDLSISYVPEPATVGLMLLGGLAAVRRRKCER